MALSLPKETIRSLIASLTGVPLSRVYWAGEAEKSLGPVGGKIGKLTLNATAIADVNDLEARRTWDGTQNLVQWGNHETATISIRADNFVGYGEAYALLEALRFNLKLPTSRATLRAADLAFVDAPSIVPLSYTVDSRAVRSASMDVRFAFVACTDPAPDADGWIEKVTSKAPPVPSNIPAIDLTFTKKT